MSRSARRLFWVVLVVLLALGLMACDRDAVPPLVEVTELSPRAIELGDRLELHGAGFPQGRTAHIAFRGTLFRPGQPPVRGATVDAEGIVASTDRIDLLLGEALEERFCGHGDHAAHTTMTGDVEVAFASAAAGAPPLVGVMHGLTLDVSPSSVRAGVAESRLAEGARVLTFLGVTPGQPSPRGLPIERVAAGSPADQAGFQVGDLLVGVDGVHVRDPSDVAPMSARTTQITLRHADSDTEETKTVAMIGYAGERIPSEYAPALLLVGLALALLVLLILPAPALVSAIELRIARRLRLVSLKGAILAVFGRGPRAIACALASVLAGTFALGPYVVGPDVDAAVLLLSGLALLLAGRVASARGARASLRAAAEVAVTGVVLGLSAFGMVVHGGAIQLGEIVRGQGGAPWEFAALRQPVAAALALAYLGALLALLRPRDDASLLVEGRTLPATGGHLLERLGLFVASALAVATFFGGWQLPAGIEPRTLALQVAAALVFVLKTWAVAAALLGATSIASPWSTSEARSFLLRRILPVLAAGGLLLELSRRLPPSESLEAALGATAVTAAVLLGLRAALRIRGAMLRPEPHASPFL